jgi:hypothetical protein
MGGERRGMNSSGDRLDVFIAIVSRKGYAKIEFSNAKSVLLVEKEDDRWI